MAPHTPISETVVDALEFDLTVHDSHAGRDMEGSATVPASTPALQDAGVRISERRSPIQVDSSVQAEEAQSWIQVKGSRTRTILSSMRVSRDVGGRFGAFLNEAGVGSVVQVVPALASHTSRVAYVADSCGVRRRRISIVGGSQAPSRENPDGPTGEGSGFDEFGDRQMESARDGLMTTQVDSGSDLPNESDHAENESLEAEDEDSDSIATLLGGEDDVGSIVSGTEEPTLEEDALDVDVRVLQLVLREAFRSLDEVDVCQIFRRRATVMKSVPWCIRGPFRSALNLMLQEIVARHEISDGDRVERGWKGFFMLPRLLSAQTLPRRAYQQRQVEGEVHVVQCRSLVRIVGHECSM